MAPVPKVGQLPVYFWYSTTVWAPDLRWIKKSAREIICERDYMNTVNTPSMRERWLQMRSGNPKLRIRDAAALLRVSEVELLALGCGASDRAIVRLREDWGEILKQVPFLGRTMALTRNEAAVHERKGEYQGVDIYGAPHHMGQVLGLDIDLRLFLGQWKSAYALTDETATGVRRSLQFFDSFGDAIHKIYPLEEGGDLKAFSEIVTRFEHPDQSPEQSVCDRPQKVVQVPPEIDVAAFRQAWKAMQDTHDLFGLLRQFEISRTGALEVAGADFARRVDASATRLMLMRAAETQLPIMVFVGNRGCIQIHTGPVQNIKVMHEWLNVLDPDFNLHLRQDLVASTWVVKKPTRDGIVTALELYDSAGENIALFFGKRKPGAPESTAWRAIIEKVV
jgi:putative hemin transport protein